MSPAETTSKTPVLEVRGLGKRFPGVVALADVSLRLEAGEVHGLVGQNGAGKSTLINILSGMYEADEGTVHLGGAPASIRGTRDALSRGIATVYQELSLLPNLTVAENLALGREPRSAGFLDRPRMRASARAALRTLGLEIDPGTQVSSLSLAERQMIEIAKALASEPRILILDEPTAPLGARESQLLFSAIARIKAKGVAILYVSHRFAEVLALCDLCTVLRNGRHVITTSLSGWTEARLTDAMVGKRTERFERLPRRRGETLLAVHDLSWRNRVHGVGFEARRFEIVALTGLLGAGQSEVARLLGGDLRPGGGRIAVGGKTVFLRSPADALGAGICLLTEERKQEGILPNRPLRENLAVASLRRRASLGIVDAGAERTAASRAAETFGVVAASLEVPIRTLSGGNQQKALLARAHLADAEVIVLVEPTRGVDVGARTDIYRRLDELARLGKAIFVVSSDLAEILTLADRILVMRHGRLHAETTPADVSEEELNLMVQGASAA
jgi:ABC-type sugar transport system ATPase subunit